jgi:hypothetical protein
MDKFRARRIAASKISPAEDGTLTKLVRVRGACAIVDGAPF